MKSIEHLKVGIAKDPELYIEEFENHMAFITNLLAIESYSELQSSLHLVNHCLNGMIDKVDFRVLFSLLFGTIHIFNSEIRLTTVQLFVKYCRIMNQKQLKIELPLEINQKDPICWYWDWSFNVLLKMNDKNLRRYLLNGLITDLQKYPHLESQFLGIMQPYLEIESVETNQPDSINPSKYALRILMQGIHSKFFKSKLSMFLMSTCVFHPVVAVAMSSTQFILKPSKLFASTVQEDEEEENDEMVNKKVIKQQSNELKRLTHLLHVSKNAGKKSGKRVEDRLKKSIKKHEKLVGKSVEDDYVSQSHTIIRQLSNPYEFYDRIYKLCLISSGATRLSSKHRDLKLRLAARLIFVHKLHCQQYYQLIMRWMHPHLPSCPNTLHCLMESIHDQTPVEWIKPAIRAIADRFIVEAQGDDRMTVGLGVVKSICEKCPNCFEQEHFDGDKDENDYSKELAGPDLLSDLCMYTKYKGKSVVNASKRLLSFYREENPLLLPKNMRGRPQHVEKEVSDSEDTESDDSGSFNLKAEYFEQHGAQTQFEEDVEATFQVDAITAEDQLKIDTRVKEKHSHSHTRKKKAIGASISNNQKRKRKNAMMLRHGGKFGTKKMKMQ